MMFSKILKAVAMELMDIKEKMGVADDSKLMLAIAHLIKAIEILDDSDDVSSSASD